MVKTPNHEYNVPDQGQENWHNPLNENFEAHDTDIELRDKGSTLSSYQPDAGAKFLATDTGVVYFGDGTSWNPQYVLPGYDDSADEVSFSRPVVATELAVGTLRGGLTNGTSLSTIAGNNLSIDSNGQLNASGGSGGGGNWTENNSLLEPSDSSIDGIGVDEVSTPLLTTGSGAVTVQVDGARVLELTAESGDDAGNVVAGHSANSVTSGKVGATIAGGGIDDGSTDGPHQIGGDYGTISGGARHAVAGNWGTVGGGEENAASDNAATVGGGRFNHASGSSSTIAGGQANEAKVADATVGGGLANLAGSSRSTVGGGFENEALNVHSTVSGGSTNTASGEAATVGGGASNKAQALYATIAGGGPADPNDTVGTNNRVYDNYGTIGGGGENRVGTDNGDPTDATFATVAGGDNNTASASNAAIGGGQANEASNFNTTVSGGGGNVASGSYSTVGGGRDNEATGDNATVSGGGGSFAGNVAAGANSTVGGGQSNAASGKQATIGGGQGNTASGEYATVPGGRENIASGDQSFAAGDYAHADADWSFVWVDGSGESDSFGGENDRFKSSTDDGASDVNGQATFNVKATNGVRFVTDTDNSAVTWISGGQSGWSTSCSSAVKTNVQPADTESMLDGVCSLSLNTWEYTDGDDDGSGVRHVSPMAEEFADTFDVGEGDTGINSINADGVALAAIQGLSAKLDKKDEQIDDQTEQIEDQREQIDDLKAENDALRERLATVEDRLDDLEG